MAFEIDRQILQAITDLNRLSSHVAIYAWGAQALASGRVLDLGCEFGFGSAIILGTNPRLQVTAVDTDFSSLCYSGELVTSKRFSKVNANAARLPVQHQTVYGIFLVNLLHLVDQPSVVLSEVVRALHPGGYAVISIPQEHYFPLEKNRLIFLEQLERELSRLFTAVTYPQEISVRFPPDGDFVFSSKNPDDMWVALCQKGHNN